MENHYYLEEGEIVLSGDQYNYSWSFDLEDWDSIIVINVGHKVTRNGVGRDRRVMHRAPECEVRFHVPFQRWQYGADAAQPW